MYQIVTGARIRAYTLVNLTCQAQPSVLDRKINKAKLIMKSKKEKRKRKRELYLYSMDPVDKRDRDPVIPTNLEGPIMRVKPK